MGYILSIASTFIVALILFAATGADAQEREKVIECLGTVDAPWYEGLRDLEGEDIWVGYENGGFDVPADVHYLRNIYGTGEEGQPVVVWIFYAPSTLATYWFPFVDTTITEVPGETYMAMHPCGAFRVVGSG